MDEPQGGGMLGWVLGCAGWDGPARIEALRGGVGYWPENSTTAIEGAIAEDLDAIQLDVVLTRDHVPVLNRGPFLEPERCARADGTPLDASVLVRRTPAGRLEDYVCGGLPDPDYPNALVVPEPIVTLDALIEALHRGPYLTVHLAIQQETPLTGPPDVFATAIVDRWLAADLPNDLVVSSPDPVLLAAFDDRARSQGADLFAIRTWPADGASEVQNVLQGEADRAVGGLDYVALVEAVGADGLLLDARSADRWLVGAARREGVPVWISVSGSDPAVARSWSHAPIEVLVTAYPGDL